MDIGPQMCARYSLTQEEITILIGEIGVTRRAALSLLNRSMRCANLCLATLGLMRLH